MTDELSHARLRDFLDEGIVDVSSGGEPETSWWKRKFVSVVAAVGLAVSMLFGPVAAEASRAPKAKPMTERIVDEFQQKLDAARADQTLVFLDHDKAKTSAAYILSKINKALERDGRRLLSLEEVLVIKEAANQTDTGFLYRLPVLPGPNANEPSYRFGVAVANTSDVTMASLTSALSMYAPELFRPDMPLTHEEFTRMVSYHEGLGHGTEGPEIYRGDFSHVHKRSLQELRADTAALVGTTRDTGNTRIAQSVCYMRTMGTFNGARLAFQKKSQQLLMGVLSYNIGPNGQKAVNIMNEIISTKEGLAMVRGLDDAGVVALANAIFDRVRPDDVQFGKDCQTVVAAAAATENVPVKGADGKPVSSKFTVRDDPELTLRVQSYLKLIDRAEAALLKKGTVEQPRRVTWAKEAQTIKLLNKHRVITPQHKPGGEI